MRQFVRKVLPFVQFVPMFLLLFFYKRSGDWIVAFEVSGAVAALMLAASFFAVRQFDKILLSINCFLIGGAAMFLFNIGWLQNLYLYLGQTTPLVWFLVIGVVTTFSSPSGFIGVKNIQNRKKVIGLSLIFLAAVCVAIFASIYFRGDMFFGGVLPWISLMIFKDFLVGDYLLVGVGVFGTAALFLLRNGGVKGAIFLFVGLKVLKGFLKGRNS